MKTNEQPAIEARGLTYAYPGQPAVFSGLDITVPRGSVFGLLGANGIGKSTLMKVLAGLITDWHWQFLNPYAPGLRNCLSLREKP